MKTSVVLLTCLLAGASTVHAQTAQLASGKIVSVRRVDRSITVDDAMTGEILRYSVPGDATITLAGATGRLGFLRAGDTVDVEYVVTSEGRQAGIVRVPQPTPAMDQRIAEGPMSTITGTVEQIRHRARTMTVRGDQSGERFTYAFPEGTPVNIGGRLARFGQINQGDNVILRFRNEETGEREVARVQVPNPQPPLAERVDESAPAAPPAGLMAQTNRAQLPRTAGDLPAMLATGLVLLCGAVVVGIIRRRARLAV